MISQVSQSHSLTWTCSKGIPIHPLFRGLSSQTRQLPELNLIFRRLFVAVSNPKKIATDNMPFSRMTLFECLSTYHFLLKEHSKGFIVTHSLSKPPPPKKNISIYHCYCLILYSSVFQCKNWCQKLSRFLRLPTTERRRVGSNARSRPSKSAPGIAGRISTNLCSFEVQIFHHKNYHIRRWNFG